MLLSWLVVLLWRQIVRQAAAVQGVGTTPAQLVSSVLCPTHGALFLQYVT
jgi:hypothetical protein